MKMTFDPHDRNSWYFGMMTRQEAQDILNNEKEGGVFLVRDSSSIIGDYVLCVKENNKVSHYIINKITNPDQQIRFKIGDKIFADIPSLLAFYKTHLLFTTALLKPATKHVEKVITLYDFHGNDAEDLPFKKNEILTIISKDEENWWTARNSQGREGSIPVIYTQTFMEGMTVQQLKNLHLDSEALSIELKNMTVESATQPVKQALPIRKTHLEVKLPAFARVKQVRVPNAYDKTALKLDIDDIIKVTKTNINGQWEGELNGKTGHFPFTHVEFIPTNESSSSSPIESNGTGEHSSLEKLITPT